MKVFLACLVGAAAIGALWETMLEPTLSSLITFATLDRQAMFSAIMLAFLGTIWGWFARKVFVKRVMTS